MEIRNLWHLNIFIILHRCLICSIPLFKCLKTYFSLLSSWHFLWGQCREELLSRQKQTCNRFRMDIWPHLVKHALNVGFQRTQWWNPCSVYQRAPLPKSSGYQRVPLPKSSSIKELLYQRAPLQKSSHTKELLYQRASLPKSSSTKKLLYQRAPLPKSSSTKELLYQRAPLPESSSVNYWNE